MQTCAEEACCNLDDLTSNLGVGRPLARVTSWAKKIVAMKNGEQYQRCSHSIFELFKGHSEEGAVATLSSRLSGIQKSKECLDECE